MLRELKIADTSLWTIDIAHLCALKKIKHKMFTVSWGVKDSYQSSEYYTKDKRFLAERERVNRVFASHETLGICVELKEVGLELIKLEVSKSNVCIVLVDATKLNGENMSSDDENSLEHVKHCRKASWCKVFFLLIFMAKIA